MDNKLKVLHPFNGDPRSFAFMRNAFKGQRYNHFSRWQRSTKFASRTLRTRVPCTTPLNLQSGRYDKHE